MSQLLTITMQERPDRAVIGTGAGHVAALINEYSGDILAEAEIDLSAMDAPTLEAFKVVCDYFTYQLEATYPIINVEYDDVLQEFDLTGSYLRSAVSTDSPAALADGTPITLRVEFAGFETNGFVDVTLPYNEALSTADDNALKNAGVTLLGTGAQFTITSIRECKIYFFKPDAVSGQYVIMYPAQETVIPAE